MKIKNNVIYIFTNQEEAEYIYTKLNQAGFKFDGDVLNETKYIADIENKNYIGTDSGHRLYHNHTDKYVNTQERIMVVDLIKEEQHYLELQQSRKIIYND